MSATRPRLLHRTERHRRTWALGALLLVLLAIAIVWRAATESAPPLLLHRTLPARVRLPGSAPAIAWPREGQAAVEVEEIGSFGSSGASTPVPIASVAKVMTAYLTLLEHPLAPGQQGFVVKVTSADVAEEGERVALGESTLSVKAGERLTERQALQALLLPSANNIAALLARYDAGGTTAFVARMNATARALGMRSTTYTDPSGFNDETVSTAADQLKLARVAMKISTFAAIVAEPSAALPGVGRVANYDGLVGRDGYVGVKTGSDRAAGGCLVFARRVTADGRRVTVLGVVLGQRKGALIESAIASAERLGDSAATSLRVETALPAGARVLSGHSVDGRETTAVTAKALLALGWGGLEMSVDVLARPAMTRLHERQAMATVSVQGDRAGASGAVSTRAVAGPSLGWRLRHLL
ncbi:MAG: D-alanyl-D-alanine carboxypeptidase family protein [Solirubrobacteraceae bacterium]